jgi:hypothetical protein
MATGNSVTVNETKLSLKWANLEILTFNQDITLKVDCEDTPLNENENGKLII